MENKFILTDLIIKLDQSYNAEKRLQSFNRNQWPVSDVWGWGSKNERFDNIMILFLKERKEIIDDINNLMISLEEQEVDND